MIAATQAGSGGLLSPEQIAFYREQGYLVIENVVEDATLRRARAALTEFVEGARGLTESNDVYDLEPTHRPDAPRVRRMKQPHRLYPVFTELVRHPRLLGILQQLLGPDIRMFGSKLNIKDPFCGSPVEWHQDWAFYPHTNEDLLAVGIMMEECTEENGPLLVIPGSHRGPIFDHHAAGTFCGAIDPLQLGDLHESAVPLTGPAGSMTFHHVRMIHGSAQNRSTQPRPLLLYMYNAVDAWPILGIPGDLAAYDADIITGSPTLAPRAEKVPIRIPLPKPPMDGSIYERQESALRRFFDAPKPPSS